MAPRPNRLLTLFVAFVCVAAAAGCDIREKPAARAAVIDNLVEFELDDTVRIAQPDVAGPTLEIYEDYQCPVCLEFEQSDNNALVREMAVKGQIAIMIHPLTIFQDDMPITRENSRRALMASLCVQDPRKWLRYHDELFAHQPDELQKGGFPYEQLIQLARKAGVPVAEFTACLKSPDTAERADSLNELARYRGVVGTPTIRFKGKDLDWTASWRAAEQNSRTVRGRASRRLQLVYVAGQDRVHDEGGTAAVYSRPPAQ
ncbi:MAG: thioredoxin domain-containing protein [Microbispora sp.]|nr:thioredoxin domain-containing protein [Microbispora sp.]